MERLSNTRQSSGFSCRGLRIWGLLLTLCGIIGRGLLQNRILGLGDATVQQTLEVLDASGGAMTIATISLVLQMLETCAVPIFAWLLVTGARHTSDMKKYLLRVAALALVSEIPYDLAMSGNVFDISAQNPVFGLALALVMLMFFRYYEGKGLKPVLIKLLVTVVSVLWAVMLKIDSGICVVVIVAALWLTRNKPMMQNLFGAAAAMLCSAVSIFYMAAPMVFLAIHFCNGEKGENENRLINYLAYPVMLLGVWLAARFAL